MNFKEYFKLCELALDQPLGTVIPNSAFGAIPSDEGKPNSGDPAPKRPERGDFNLGLPQVTMTSRISFLGGAGQQQPGKDTSTNDRRSLVHMSFDNNINLVMSHDAFKSQIHGEPAVGKMATVVFQRRVDDQSRIPSKVQSITVH